MYDISELRSGNFIVSEGRLLRVLNYHHNKTGRGGAVIKLKVRDAESGSITEILGRPGDKFQPGEVVRQRYQFLYSDGDDFNFMNMDDYEQVSLNREFLDEAPHYLTENMEVYLVFWGEKVLGVDLPATVKLKITYTEPAVKGNTTGNVMKNATLETGYEIKVPMFVDIDEEIIVNTQTGEYSERA